jgi:predicted amidophosphoribosyltransferase
MAVGAYNVDIPIWYLILGTALLPTGRAFYYLMKPRKHRPGHCFKCGYDLRATPERCPECGEVPNKQEAKV